MSIVYSTLFLQLHQLILLEISAGDSEIFKVKIKYIFIEILFSFRSLNPSYIKGLNEVEYWKCGS